MDYWQLLGTIAAISFTVGIVSQCRVTFKTQCVDGMSQLQWFVFSVASAMFVGYYTHLDQWMMVSVSVFGMLCCLAMLAMIFRIRRVVE